jgi:pimeloyl-ACP methyl ester carboxylesterase
MEAVTKGDERAVPGAGHGSMEEAPAVTIAAIRAFLTGK